MRARAWHGILRVWRVVRACCLVVEMVGEGWRRPETRWRPGMERTEKKNDPLILVFPYILG